MIWAPSMDAGSLEPVTSDVADNCPFKGSKSTRKLKYRLEGFHKILSLQPEQPTDIFQHEGQLSNIISSPHSIAWGRSDRWLGVSTQGLALKVKRAVNSLPGAWLLHSHIGHLSDDIDFIIIPKPHAILLFH